MKLVLQVLEKLKLDLAAVTRKQCCCPGEEALLGCCSQEQEANRPEEGPLPPPACLASSSTPYWQNLTDQLAKPTWFAECQALAHKVSIEGWVWSRETITY